MLKRDQKVEYIVRVKKIKPVEHNIAAWKIAYADFVTAMMAFFLLLWLLNASLTVDLVKVGNAFEEDPDARVVNINVSGSNSAKGGTSAEIIEGTGQKQIILEKIFVEQELTTKVALENEVSAQKLTPFEFHEKGTVELNSGNYTMQDIENLMKKALRKVRSESDNSIAETKIFSDRAGLNIEFFNDETQRTFRWGSAEVTRPLYNTLYAITRFLSVLNRPIVITGHSALEGSELENWELSIHRADNVRRVIARMGIPEKRLFSIGGKGTSEPIEENDLKSMKNIRVQITLLANNDHQVINQRIRNSAPPFVSGN